MFKHSLKTSKWTYFFAEKLGYQIPKIKTLKYAFKGVIYGKNTTISNSDIGKMCRFGYDNLIVGSKIGDYSYTASNTKIYYTQMGKFCSISWNVSIGGYEHPMYRISSHGLSCQSKYRFVEEDDPNAVTIKETFIGNDVWVGCNAYIKGGVKIGNGAVIGAGAVVIKDVPAYAIVVGNPAKIIKYRFNQEIIIQFEKMKWWDFSEDKIKENIHFFRKDMFDASDLNQLLNIK